MAIVSISRIQHRRGLQQDLPQLAAAEIGWSMDEQRLFIGNGPLAEGAPRLGNTEILTEHSDILRLAEAYTYRNEDAGYIPNTGGRTSRFTSIAYGNDIYVGVGTNGSILTSTDAETWSPIYGGISATLNSVCFGNGLFVAVGAGGTIIYSANGSTWNQATTAVFLTLTSVVYAGGTVQKFIATSTTGSIISSTNAVTWSVIATGVTESLNSIDFDGTYAVAVGNNGTIILSNANNVSVWTSQTSPSSYNFRSVKYTDQWTITGEYSTILVSMDGADWTYGYTDTFRAAANNSSTAGNTWVFVGDGGVIYRTSTTDLVKSSSPTTYNLYDVCYSVDDSLFVAVGQNGTILTSPSGIIWTQQTIATSEDINKIIYDVDNALYVGVGTNGLVITSADGSSWSVDDLGIATPPDLYGITVWDGTTYIAAGAGGTIYTSPDVSAWTAISTGISDNLEDVKAFDIGGGTWRAVAVGNSGAVIYSTDSGASWNTSTVPVGFSDDIHSVNRVTWVYNTVTYTKWFAVGNNASILVSTDNGVSWTTVANVPATNHMFNLYYGLGYFWVVGSIGYSTLYALDITDPDSITPQSLAIVFSTTTGYNGPALFSSTYNGSSTYVIVGQYNSIFSSTDGQNYISQSDKNYVVANLTTSDILGIVYSAGNVKFTAVGNKGLITNSTDSITWDGFSYNFGNSETIRTIQQKLDDFVSVKDFGAKGDGLTDDTEAINRAMYEIYCRNINPSARKTLYFPGGRYIISDGLHVPTNACLVGEGMNNTIIQQTADPSYVSYVMITADSKQQYEAQAGLNGAVLPSDIFISSLALESSYDALWLWGASRVTLDKVRMTGGQSNNPNASNDDGSIYTGVYIQGGNLEPPADLNFIDCVIENYNYGVYQPSTEYSRNLLFNSTSFKMMFNAFNLTLLDGMVNTMTISNCVFDSIGFEAVKTNHANNIISSFNSYRDVGNNYGGIGSAASYILDFGDLSAGCASINDQFDRTITEAYSSGYNYVYGNTKTIQITAGHEIRVGLWEQAGGEIYALTGAQTNEPTGFTMEFDDNSYQRKIQYMLRRNNAIRSGIIMVTYNADALTYSIDDDSNETSDVGIVFSLSDDGTTISLDYTSTAGTAADFVMAESYLDLSW